MKKRTNQNSSSLPALLQQWMHTALDKLAAVIEECEWFPGSRFSRIP